MKDSSELHEDWATLKGYPPYAYILDWRYPEVLALLKVRVTGKGKCERRVVYYAKKVKTLFATPLYRKNVRTNRRDGYEDDAEHPEYFRDEICFTTSELMKVLQARLGEHSRSVEWDMRRLMLNMAELSIAYSGYAKTLEGLKRTTHDSPVLRKILRLDGVRVVGVSKPSCKTSAKKSGRKAGTSVSSNSRNSSPRGRKTRAQKSGASSSAPTGRYGRLVSTDSPEES